MPRTRSTFTKRQKEQTRQQKQRDKAALRTQRKLDKQADPGSERPPKNSERTLKPRRPCLGSHRPAPLKRMISDRAVPQQNPKLGLLVEVLNPRPRGQ